MADSAAPPVNKAVSNGIPPPALDLPVRLNLHFLPRFLRYLVFYSSCSHFDDGRHRPPGSVVSAFPALSERVLHLFRVSRVLDSSFFKRLAPCSRFCSPRSLPSLSLSTRIPRRSSSFLVQSPSSHSPPYQSVFHALSLYLSHVSCILDRRDLTISSCACLWLYALVIGRAHSFWIIACIYMLLTFRNPGAWAGRVWRSLTCESHATLFEGPSARRHTRGERSASVLIDLL